jgi:hypothetical protein
MGDSASEKSTTIALENGRLAKIEDVDVAAALDSDKPLEPEIAAKLRSALTVFETPYNATEWYMQEENRLPSHAPHVS